MGLIKAMMNYNKTCIETGKSSAKSGGKNRSACFLVYDGFPDEPFTVDQFQL